MTETNLDKLKLQIDVLELNLNQLKYELDALKCSEQLDEIDLENSYRVPLKSPYYTINTVANSTFKVLGCTEDSLPPDNMRYLTNNYFRTELEAEAILYKIKFLLKLQRLHNIYCPDYEPDWITHKGLKYYVTYDTKNKEYVPATMEPDNYYFAIPNTVYFPDLETTKKVCAKLNERLKENE